MPIRSRSPDSDAVVVRAAPPRTARKVAVKGRTIETYKARRDFTVTAEPAPSDPRPGANAPLFVVQKHDASRLHWDFRLEHGGVLWSWAVPRGPSLDPHDKRLAVHVEDHPIDYADFHGTIPEGQYGAGTVETWDRGTWAPVGDADAGLAKGELKFVVDGARLQGKFVLIRLKPRPKERAENWLLIKEHDEHERSGADAGILEAEIPPPEPRQPASVYGDATGPEALAEKTAPARKRSAAGKQSEAKSAPAKKPPATKDDAPAPGAVRGKLPETQAPQLASLVDEPPDGAGWLSEVKFDGYRFLAFVDGERVRMVTRNGHDWTNRIPRIAQAIARLGFGTAILDGELVALREDGVSSFAALQDALSQSRDDKLVFYVFDLLHLNGWDLRPCALTDRKAALVGLSEWKGTLRYSDHTDGNMGEMRRLACGMGLEGIICKQADAPYRAGRTRTWLKLKCQGREEFVVIGWTPPAGSRAGLGALHVGFYDDRQRLHYAGGVGTGFSDRELADLRRRLDALASDRPNDLLLSGDPLDRAIKWVRPEMVVEVQYLTWTGAGRLRHASYLGRREDRSAAEVVREIPDPEATRHALGAPRKAVIVQAPPRAKAAARKPEQAGEARSAPSSSAIVTARAPSRAGGAETIDGVKVTHADRELWPGITKHDLAAYWDAVAPYALPEIAGRPLALVRCPEGVDGEHFFQKHGKPGFPAQIRNGNSDGAPWLAIDDVAGLVAAAQVSAIELHAWGASGDDPLHPDRLIFDLDPGDGISLADIVSAAYVVRERLEAEGMAAFCRTSGGKGLHVVTPLVPSADWDTARAWSRAFAERMEADLPDRFVASVPKARRTGRILVDWLRNGLGSTAIASFSPRARPGAGVATRLEWKEVTPKLDLASFNLKTVPARLAKQKSDPWADFAAGAVKLPGAAVAPKPKKRAK